MLSELTTALRSLRQPGMALALEAWVADPANAERCAMECVQSLVETQQQAGQNLRMERFLRGTGLPGNMTLANFRSSAACGLPATTLSHLRSLAWLDRQQNLVLTGDSQTGKTHLACALARQALSHGRTAHYVRVPALLVHLREHNDAHTFDRCLKQLGRPELLVLDEFALERASAEETYLLRRLVDHRERTTGAMIVASSNLIEDWDDRFADAAAANGIFGRLLSRSHDIVLKRPIPKPASKRSEKKPSS